MLRSFYDVCRLRSFLTLSNLELYGIAFLKALISFRIDRAVMDEHIRAILPSNEAIALCIVEPLNRTFQTIHLPAST